MKTNKKAENLERCNESTMIFTTGEEVTAYLDWESDRYEYYVWLEPSASFANFCEEIERDDLLIGLENDLAQIGVHKFGTLDEVNEHLRKYCGDDNPAMFYLDEDYFICGA